MLAIGLFLPHRAGPSCRASCGDERPTGIPWSLPCIYQICCASQTTAGMVKMENSVEMTTVSAAYV